MRAQQYLPLVSTQFSLYTIDSALPWPFQVTLPHLPNIYIHIYTYSSCMMLEWMYICTMHACNISVCVFSMCACVGGWGGGGGGGGAHVSVLGFPVCWPI